MDKAQMMNEIGAKLRKAMDEVATTDPTTADRRWVLTELLKELGWCSRRMGAVRAAGLEALVQEAKTFLYDHTWCDYVGHEDSAFELLTHWFPEHHDLRTRTIRNAYEAAAIGAEGWEDDFVEYTSSDYRVLAQEYVECRDRIAGAMAVAEELWAKEPKVMFYLDGWIKPQVLAADGRAQTSCGRLLVAVNEWRREQASLLDETDGAKQGWWWTQWVNCPESAITEGRVPFEHAQGCHTCTHTLANAAFLDG